jgi:hypothetical protein
MIQYAAPLRFIQYALGNTRFRWAHDGFVLLCSPGSRVASYFTAPKRLSNEFGGTIGAEPET